MSEACNLAFLTFHKKKGFSDLSSLESLRLDPEVKASLQRYIDRRLNRFFRRPGREPVFWALAFIGAGLIVLGLALQGVFFLVSALGLVCLVVAIWYFVAKKVTFEKKVRICLFKLRRKFAEAVQIRPRYSRVTEVDGQGVSITFLTHLELKVKENSGQKKLDHEESKGSLGKIVNFKSFSMGGGLGRLSGQIHAGTSEHGDKLKSKERDTAEESKTKTETINTKGAGEERGVTSEKAEELPQRPSLKKFPTLEEFLRRSYPDLEIAELD